MVNLVEFSESKGGREELNVVRNCLFVYRMSKMLRPTFYPQAENGLLSVNLVV